MRAYSLVALSGVLYFLAFAGFDIWPLAFVALVPALWALDGVGAQPPPSGKRLVALGLTFGLVTNVGGYYWLVGMLERFSGFPWVLCVLFALVLWLYQGGQLTLFSWLYVRQRRAGVAAPLAAALGLCGAEWIYPLLFDHFFGATLHDQPLPLQVADLGGPLLVTGLLAAENAALYALLRARLRRQPLPWAAAGATAALWAAGLGYGAYRIDAVDDRAARAPSLSVGLVQANMGIFQKRSDPLEGLRRHLRQSAALERQHELDLLVWPESAYGWYLDEGVTNVRDRVMGRLRTPLLFGGLSRRDGKRYNTAFLTDAQGELQGAYDKHYLLAFGEYLPLGEQFPVLYEWSPNSGRFSPGDHVRPLELGPYRLGVLICYEDILPSFVRGAVRQGDPHVLVNLTNDAWFGDTHEPWQHLALAKLRAVEHHRPLVRATNSGVSAVIDPVGRTLTRSGVSEQASLHARVPLLTGHSLYTWVGDWPGWLSLLIALTLTFIYGRRKAHE